VSLLRQLGLLPQGAGDEEERLISAAQRGDRRAFDALVRSHQTILRGFLARRVGPEAVDDILQDTWIAAWAALPKFSRRSRFKAWLLGIAVHKAQDYHRARGRSPVEPLLEETEVGQPNQPDPYAAIELRHTIKALLARLPNAQREVLEMYYYAELTLPEIAAALERNQNTVKYQFYRAHAQVAEGLGPLYASGALSSPQGTR
jgi:RNA polymerase sigma-70 factor (ECF subfamily)